MPKARPERARQSRPKPRATDQYVDLFDFAPITYAMFDRAGVVEQINLAGGRLLGVERSRLIGHPFIARVAEGDRRKFLEHLRRCRSSSEVIESELRLTAADGRVVPCRLYSQRTVRDERASVPTIITDLTEYLQLADARKHAERQRDQAEHEREVARASLNSTDRLIAIVSHELRTPLTPSLVAATLLAESPLLDDHTRKLAATIKRNVEIEAALIDEILDLAKIDRDRIDLHEQPIDVHQTLDEAVSICRTAADAKHLTIGIYFGAPSSQIRGDLTRLRQVFWNLLNNAIKFSGPGGTIQVRTANTPDGALRVTFQDNGSGMDADTLETLFLPFESRHAQIESRGGLGLGLSICKGILDAHGGQIWAASEGPGRGSTFEIELPTVRPSVQNL